MSILDKFPFPFDDPLGAELVRVMAALFRTEREAHRFAQQFGVDLAQLESNLSLISLWHDLIGMLATTSRLRDAVQATRDGHPRNPRTQFLDALLEGKSPPVSAEPLASGSAGFDDSVTDEEALLFFDDLTIPAGKVPNLIATLEKIVAVAPAVCLLRVSNARGSFFGTGFRISKKLVLTNHHVLCPNGDNATQVHADFGFDVEPTGRSSRVTSLTAITTSIQGDITHDWAVIEVPRMLSKWPILSLDDAPAPRVGDAAYILQHPGGQQKRLGFVRNTVSDVGKTSVKYLTDTEPGSSGAPVLDQMGRVFAIHRMGGRPIEVVNKPPVSKNEGILISRVVAGLRASGVMRE